MKTPTIVIAICSAAVAIAFAQSPMREGRWEITSQMEMANMPMKMPATKTIQCVTKKDLEGHGALPGGPGGQAKNESCKVTDHKVDGNKITWKMACTPPQEMRGTGEIVVNGDAYDGLMTMTTPGGTMTMKYSAKRLGECTE